MPDPSQDPSFYNDDAGFTVDDAPARCRDCRDGVGWHCGDCWCCREAADAPGRVIVALAAVVDLLVCKAQLPMGTQQAPVEHCECRDCETARLLVAAMERLEAA